jgi:hypothetical protein
VRGGGGAPLRAVHRDDMRLYPSINERAGYVIPHREKRHTRTHTRFPDPVAPRCCCYVGGSLVEQWADRPGALTPQVSWAVRSHCRSE